MQEWAIRQALGNDLAFIYSTWLNSYRADSHYRKTCTKFIFFKEYPRVVDLILGRATTIVACLPDQPNVIIGYLVHEPGVCHYAFTKESFRKLGVMSTLWNHAFKEREVVTSHKTRCVEGAMEFHRVTFNPFLLFERGEHGKTEETQFTSNAG